MVSAREVLHSSRSVNWFTPTRFTEAARRVMGSIDLDPASCEAANRLVMAAKYFDKDKNGLAQKWHGNIFCNPPYGRGGQAAWSKKMIEEYQSNNFNQGILLVNAATDTQWFQPLWAYPICFTKKRIKFVKADGSAKDSPTHGSAFIYFGSNKIDFANEFFEFGPIVMSTRHK
jgi:ParB family chromosome partitioning protein